MISRLRDFVWLTVGLVLTVCLAGCKAAPEQPSVLAPSESAAAPVPDAAPTEVTESVDSSEKRIIGKIDPVVNGTTKYYLVAEDGDTCWVWAITWLSKDIGQPFTCKNWEETF